ncbi:MAG: hypothetical protein K6G65_10940 [Lachnospiraceae bacterium]|nr:hypothetical protein [Lachnospiraceae bacterium]
MNKICKQYRMEVKSFFPLIAGKEKAYINALIDDVCDYCAEERITTIEKLYEAYGTPSEVATTYYSMADTTEMIKKMRISKWIKRCMASVLVIVALCASVYSYHLYREYRLIADSEIVTIETTIE